MLRRPIGVRETVVERMLRGQKRNDGASRNVRAQIDHEVPEIVFLFRPDGAVGQEHERAFARQPADGVVRVDPGVHAGGGFELRAWRTQLRRNHGQARLQGFEESSQSAQYTERFMSRPGGFARRPPIAVARGGPTPRSAPAGRADARTAVTGTLDSKTRNRDGQGL